jgi:pyruvate,orthophosphate dikinase
MRIYTFGNGQADGDATMKAVLGGKGANLAEMSRLGLPVPPGFTLPTALCATGTAGAVPLEDTLKTLLPQGVAATEKALGRKFGDPEKCLLLSVRSGAPVSMPGMMDTVLNLGLNDTVAEGLARETENPRFVYDAYRRFVAMFGDVVLGLKAAHQLAEDPFENLLDEAIADAGVGDESELSADALKDLVGRFKALIEKEKGMPFPEDPVVQLQMAVEAVFGSWSNDRAKTYRRINGIPESPGTACNVQAMVFGNLGDTCATGVAFTRNPSTGEKAVYGEYLINAQGEDVVAGIRTPQPLSKASAGDGETSLEGIMPEPYQELVSVFARLEDHYADMQDVEFTIQDGKLYILQTRTGKRTAAAAIKIAVDMTRENRIDEKKALQRVPASSVEQLLHPALVPEAKDAARAEGRLLAKGLPASPGAASGVVVFSAEDAEKEAAAGKSVILVRVETSPEDIQGMHVSQGILTARGGMTSHAAVVARGMGTPCVAGCDGIAVSYRERQFRAGDRIVAQGDTITIDGATGEVFAGPIDARPPNLGGELEVLLTWADRHRRMKVRANADTPDDAKKARSFGAQGIGLCRTEHMFFSPDRILAVREMILASDEVGRQKALDKLLPMQRGDFSALFEAMAGLPVTIRLLDPPLHEFLPHTDEEMEDLARATDKDVAQIKRATQRLFEQNPMLGHRGCRLAITYPEVARMQTRAIVEAALDARSRGHEVHPEIMIPLVAVHTELGLLRDVVQAEMEKVFDEREERLDVLIGTMIELPRAALTADQIAERAEFFSFGTNDLTQTTFGFSRDDIGSFLPEYLSKKVLPHDPFARLDVDGVGQLVELGVSRGRKTRPDLKVGLCGEHGGDPESIAFCHKVGLDYVSCSPFRIPVARLAAAQAALDE